MAIPLETNPNHGSDNRVHEVVGSAFRGRAINNFISTCRARLLSPRRSHQSAVTGKQELGLDGVRWFMSGLSGHTRKGKDGPTPPQHGEGVNSGYRFRGG